jgi:hypothetical protein
MHIIYVRPDKNNQRSKDLLLQGIEFRKLKIELQALLLTGINAFSNTKSTTCGLLLQCTPLYIQK